MVLVDAARHPSVLTPTASPGSPAVQMHELLDLGVGGVVTDRPDVLREVLRERGACPATV